MRSPADACDQAADLYRAIADGEADGHARATAALLVKAAAQCRKRPAAAPRPAAPAPAAEERPSASRLMRLIRAAQSALHYVPRQGPAEVYRAELVDALRPFTPAAPAPAPVVGRAQHGAKAGAMMRVAVGKTPLNARPAPPPCPHGNPRDLCTDEDCYLEGKARDAAAAPKRRGRPPKHGGMRRMHYGAVKKDDPPMPHGLGEETLDVDPVADDDLDLDELRTVGE